MKKCSACGNSLDENKELCRECEKKIKGLRELVNNNNVFNDRNIECSNGVIVDEVCSFDTKEEDRVFKRNVTILVCLILSVILSIIYLVYKDNQIEMKLQYEIINSEISSGEYINAYEDINEFLYKYKYSPYTKDVLSLKDKITPQVELMKQNENYKDMISSAGEKYFMSSYCVIKFSEALDSIGCDKNNVTIISSTQDIDGKDKYSFVYNTRIFNAEYDENLNSICIWDDYGEKIYENGNVIHQISDFVVGYDEILKLSKISKILVNLVHDHPTITRYPNIKTEQYDWNISRIDGQLHVNSYVQYREKNGNIKRDKFNIILVNAGEYYKLIDFSINGEKIIKIIY